MVSVASAGLGSDGKGKKPRVCRDCAATSLSLLRNPRPAPHPGPRCATHHRAKKRAKSKRDAELRAERQYGISDVDYQILLVAQGGRCAWCGRKIGNTVRAAIDHDHSCELCGGTGCRRCVRGLVDRKCNEILGWFGDQPDLIEVGAEYLRNPPAKRILKEAM